MKLLDKNSMLLDRNTQLLDVDFFILNQIKFISKYNPREVKKPKLTTMKTKFTPLFCFLLNLLFYDSVAQETTSSADGTINSASDSINFTVGQITNLFLSQPKGSVAQGVQQPFEIFLITGIDEDKKISLDLIN